MKTLSQYTTIIFLDLMCLGGSYSDAWSRPHIKQAGDSTLATHRGNNIDRSKDRDIGPYRITMLDTLTRTCCTNERSWKKSPKFEIKIKKKQGTNVVSVKLLKSTGIEKCDKELSACFAKTKLPLLPDWVKEGESLRFMVPLYKLEH
jgi:hypothetical protein